jgi:DNA-binding MarR family transcriptional regulator
MYRSSASNKHPLTAGDDAKTTAILWSRIAELLTVCGLSLRGQLASSVSTCGITEPQFFVLLACGHAPPQGVGQNDLAARLARSPAHTSALVEKLRSTGLIVGQRSDTDRRRQLWRLSAAGRTLLDDSLAELKSWASQLDEKLDATRRGDLIAMLAALTGSDPATQTTSEARSQTKSRLH